LCFYFAHFVARGSTSDPDGLLACSAALASLRNLGGDVCVDLARLAGRPMFEGDGGGSDLPEPLAPPLGEWIAGLAASSWVGGPGGPEPLILDGHRLYLGKYWHFEERVARALRGRMAPVEGLDHGRLEKGLATLFGAQPDGTLDWQRVAAAIAATRRFAVMSGGPGTGKTTTVVKVLALLLWQDPGLRIALAAPTGKAAARLSEAVRGGKARVPAEAAVLARIPEEASTIHRLIGMGHSAVPRHHQDNPLLLDCLVVDEASMVDLPLMARLLDALPAATRLILLGDRDQLASVEAGNVLGDITGHGQEIAYSPDQVVLLERIGAVPTEMLRVARPPPPAAADSVGLLRVSYRFTAESGIGALARAVNAGHGEEALSLLRPSPLAPQGIGTPVGLPAPAHRPAAPFLRIPGGDIAWHDTAGGDLAADCIDWALGRYAAYLSQTNVTAALDRFGRSRVLAALHGGPFGVEAINLRIEQALHAAGLIAGGDEYHGKPVMVTVNDYEVGLFNGDVGLLWRDAGGDLRAWFPLALDASRSVSLRQLPQHELAYALTVHKSQGSEFDTVYLVLPQVQSPVVTRELIYTGITRARDRITIQAGPETFVLGCQTRVRRSSALAERLGWPTGQDSRPSP
jgi:exodeoxyribonuclease V alpha subunit